MAAADWSQLPTELLETIARKLKFHADYIRFRAVCVSWRSSAPRNTSHLPCQLPWLMLPHNRARQSPSRGFFSLADDKVHFLTLPEASRRLRCCGSSNGWLFMLDESPSIFLLNPLTRAAVHLPPLSAFPNVLNFNFYEIGREYTLRRQEDADVYTCNLREMRDSFIKKAILSGSPSNEPGYVAVAILNQTGDLAFCRKGEESWRFVDDARSYSEDVIYHNGLFYAVNKFGAISVCDLHSDPPRVSFIHTPHLIGGDMQYLVNWTEELFLVTRYLELEYNLNHHQLDVGYKTEEFRVFKLDLGGLKWKAIARLGDLMFFLGGNSSVAFTATDFHGCKGNCIYFTDDYSESNDEGVNWDHDLGVYNLEDGTIEAFSCYHPRLPQSPHLCWPPAIWVTPNPF